MDEIRDLRRFRRGHVFLLNPGVFPENWALQIEERKPGEYAKVIATSLDKHLYVETGRIVEVYRFSGQDGNTKFVEKNELGEVIGRWEGPDPLPKPNMDGLLREFFRGQM